MMKTVIFIYIFSCASKCHIQIQEGHTGSVEAYRRLLIIQLLDTPQLLFQTPSHTGHPQQLTALFLLNTKVSKT